MEAATDGVGARAERQQVAAFEQRESLGVVDAGGVEGGAAHDAASPRAAVLAASGGSPGVSRSSNLTTPSSVQP